MTETDILDLIRSDEWRMDVLRVVEKLRLPDWWIGAGFVRNKVWDHLHGYGDDTSLHDVDLTYFDPAEKMVDKEVEEQLKSQMPSVEWAVVNQVRAHDWNDETPYQSTSDAMSKWPETATSIGVRLENGELKLVAPHGIEDLVNLVVRPTPAFSTEKKKKRVAERMMQKKWLEKWPKLRTEDL